MVIDDSISTHQSREINNAMIAFAITTTVALAVGIVIVVVPTVDIIIIVSLFVSSFNHSLLLV